MAVPGTTATIVAEYDGQVDRAEALGIAKKAVIALDDVYRVTVQTEDGTMAWATAAFVGEDDYAKVVTDSGWS